MNLLSDIPGLGPKTQEKLKKLGIEKPQDLLYHFPHRYIDFSHITPIASAPLNQNVTVTGKIVDFQNIYTRHGKNLQKATIQDHTGKLTLLWFNQPYLSQNIKTGLSYNFAGVITLYHSQPTIINPEYGQYNTGKIIPVYPETAGLSSKWFRKVISSHLHPLLTNVQDPLPLPFLKSNRLLPLKLALTQIHSPLNPQVLNQARTRLALNEILSLQAASQLKKSSWLSKKPKYVLKLTPDFAAKINSFIHSLPFTLTPSQKHVWVEILGDLVSTTKVCNRLLQGDVGSGKTVVAALAIYLNYLNHHLSLFLCPTEILARQHFASLKKYFPRLSVKLLTADAKLKKIAKNSIIVATHAAIFQRKIIAKNLGLLIIDEQHKFGVAQRSTFSTTLHPPHTLTMTATPIPRTISLTILGNLDISIIDTMPKNRLPVKTFLVPNHKRTSCYRWIQDQIISTKCQCFIVCPFIKPSETMESIKSATREFELLSQQVFPNFKLALIHGKTTQKSRQEIITKFTHNQINILVTTPIIEVGIDFPNATIIVIQSADRFGLAQLHQLRGRVGRGEAQSYCYLFTDSENEKAIARLKYLETHHHGLEIANFDLKNRGPGEAFSTLQHGFPSLKLADLSNLKLIEFSQKILSNLLHSHPSFDLHQLIPSSSHHPLSSSVIHN